MESSFKVQTIAGLADCPVSLEMYQEAADRELTLPQLINTKYATAEGAPTAFEQMLVTSGIFLGEDRTYGHRSPTMKRVLEGGPELNAIVRPDGSNSRTPAGRVLFPSVMLEMLESELRTNQDSYLGAFNSLVAFTRSITGNKYEQVIVNHSAPRAARGQPISQLSRPDRMLTLTTSDRTFTIPTYSIGLEISAEAMQAATLDLVGLAIREYSIEERAAVVDKDIVAMSNGDVDSGMTALPAVTLQSIDASANAVGLVTHRAWVKALRRRHRTMTVTDVICDIDTYLAVEGRTGRPVKDTEAAVDERLNTVPTISIPGIPRGVQFFVTEESILGANTMILLDRSKAIRKVVYTGASYQAIENFVMRRSTAMRMDWAERYERAGYDQAFQKITLTTA
jgi:hypothetical protein